MYTVTKDTVIAGHRYGAGDRLKAEHESKAANLLRIGHIEAAPEPAAVVEPPPPPPAPPAPPPKQDEPKAKGK